MKRKQLWCGGAQQHVMDASASVKVTSPHLCMAASRVSLWFAFLCNCPPDPSSALLRPHPASSRFQLCFLCQPWLPSNFYWLTNTVRWMCLARILYKQQLWKLCCRARLLENKTGAGFCRTCRDLTNNAKKKNRWEDIYSISKKALKYKRVLSRERPSVSERLWTTTTSCCKSSPRLWLRLYGE